MLNALDGRLAKFKMPKRVFVVDELPRNAMGKVQKNMLRDTYKRDLREEVEARAVGQGAFMNREQGSSRFHKHLLEIADGTMSAPKWP